MAGFWHIGSLAFPPRSLNKWKKNMRMSFLLSQPCVLNILNFNFPDVFMGMGKVLTFILLQLFSVFWSLDPVPFPVTSNSDFCMVSIFMKRTWKTNIKFSWLWRKFIFWLEGLFLISSILFYQLFHNFKNLNSDLITTDLIVNF